MKLHNSLSNEECVGKVITAQIDAGQPWVTYSEGNDGEEDFYRDVFIDGHCAYMDGETCEVLSFNEESETVTLYCEMGKSNSEDNWSGVFSIPYHQYLSDFGAS